MSEIELVKRLRGIADHEEKLSRIVKLRDEEIADVRMGADAIEALTAALEDAVRMMDDITADLFSDGHKRPEFPATLIGRALFYIETADAALRKVRP
jgi:division protein CdvB (Snf7/Vps24/ESCRT-III family)